MRRSIPFRARSRTAARAAGAAALVLGLGACGSASRPAGPPANAAFSHASVIGASGEIVGSTTGVSAAAGAGTGASVWFAWRPSTAGPTVVVPAGPGEPVSVRVYTGSSQATLVPVDAAPASGALAEVDAIPGRTYWLQVSTARAAAAGAFDLSLVQPGAGSGGTDGSSLATAAAAAARTRAATAAPKGAPRVSCRVPSGWVDTNAAVRCTARAVRSPLANRAQRSFVLDTAVPPHSASAAATTATATVCDKAGKCAIAGPYAVRVDLVAPIVTCNTPPPSWFATVRVSCAAIDPAGGSGLAKPGLRSFTLVASLPLGVARRDVSFPAHAPICDRAGNCAPVPIPRPVDIDHAPPVVHCPAAPKGWVSSLRPFSCSATDSGSGLADAGDGSFTLTLPVSLPVTDGHAYTSSLEVCDTAGNCTKAGPIGPIRLDRATPIVSCPHPVGWVRATRVPVRCRARDGGSGLADGADGSFALIASIRPGTQGEVTLAARRVCSRAGDCASAGPFTIGLDDAAPSVHCTTVAHGWIAGPVSVGCTVTDDGSGVRAGQKLAILSADVPAGAANPHVTLPRRRVCDTVGNCTLTPRLPAARVDRQPPLVTCARPTPGRHVGNVTIACVASDGAGSGLADPGDAEFYLSTAAAPSTLVAAAATGSRTVCDHVGNCTTAGPVGGIDVDLRTAAGTRGAPSLPADIEVLAALPSSALAATAPGAGTIAVPFDEPGLGGPSALAAACSPAPGTPLRVGAVSLACGEPAGGRRIVTKVVSLSIVAAPGLAPSGPAIAGRAWRAVARGLRRGSPVVITLDGDPIALTRAAGGGGVSAVFPIPPRLAAGAHTLAVEGTGAGGEPLLVVSRLSVESGSAHGAAGPPAPVGAPTPVTLLAFTASGALAAPHGTVSFR